MQGDRTRAASASGNKDLGAFSAGVLMASASRPSSEVLRLIQGLVLGAAERLLRSGANILRLSPDFDLVGKRMRASMGQAGGLRTVARYHPISRRWCA